jgi:hypothetical protein
MKAFVKKFLIVILLLSVGASTTLAQSRFTPNSSGSNKSVMQLGNIVATGLKCTDAGNKIIDATKDFVKKEVSKVKPLQKIISKVKDKVPGVDGGVEKVPVKDSKVDQELQKTNKTIDCLNGIAYAAAKNALSKVSNKAMDWIQTGMGGNPFYVQDPSSLMKSIRDEKLSMFLQNVSSTNPIFGNSLRSALTTQVTGKTDGLTNKTMNTPEAKKYQDFMGDFTNGGWNAWLNSTQIDSNNPIGSFFDATDSVSNAIHTAQENTRDEIQRNEGFLDMKVCVEYAQPTTTTPTQSPCLKWKTTTPGSLIAETAKNITGSPIRQLEAADQINEVLGSFFDNLLSKLFSKGLASLRDSASKIDPGFAPNGGVGSNIVIGSNGQILNSSSGSGDTLGYTASTSGYSAPEFNISHPQDIRAVLKLQYDFLNRSHDAQIEMNLITPTLGALDYCLPGPNPTWYGGLTDNFNNFLGGLQAPSRTYNLPTIGGVTLGGVLVGNPTIFDKATGASEQLSTVSYTTTSSYTGDDIRPYLQKSLEKLITDYRDTFAPKKIVEAFRDVDSDPLFAKATIEDALYETEKLPSYNQNGALLDIQYDENEADTEDAIRDLEIIRKEVNQIVKTAKARYISEQAAAGTPVNLQCINQAYIIDESPVTGVARQETDTIDPIVQQSSDSGDYFYNNL